YLTIINTLILTVIIFVFHFLIDWLRVKSDKENDSPKFRFISFILDQITHIAIIILLAVVVNTISIQPNGFYDELAHLFPNVDGFYLALVILSYLIILSPTSVLIKHFFA